MSKNRIMVAVDVSYFCYYTLFGATKLWRTSSPHAHILKKPDETDQDNLPDLTKYADFLKILEKQTLKRFDTLFWILKSNIQNDIDIADDVDIFMCCDAPVSHNWRRKIFPQYKAQRKLTPKEFNTYASIQYIINVIFKKLEIESSYNMHLLKCEKCEGDDIIAVLMRNLNEYAAKIVIASDKDFLQLEGIRMFDLMGQEKTILSKHEHTLTPKQYVIFKSIFGDQADNIPKVFERGGEKTILKLMSDPSKLKAKLQEDSTRAKQFLLNKKIIDFANIPESLTESVMNKVKTFKPKTLETSIDLNDLMQL